jgi:hypothetical protein
MSSAFRSDPSAPTNQTDADALAAELPTILMREAVGTSHRQHVDDEAAEDDGDFATGDRQPDAPAPSDLAPAAAQALPGFDPALVASYRAIRSIAFRPDQIAMVHRLARALPVTAKPARHSYSQPLSERMRDLRRGPPSVRIFMGPGIEAPRAAGPDPACAKGASPQRKVAPAGA